MTDAELRALLQQTRTIAVVGHSDKPYRPSYDVAQYLRRVGYQVFAVNPTLTTLHGEPVYPNLAALPEPIDLVNVFRRAEFLPAIVAEAIAVHTHVLWAQLGVTHTQAEAQASAAGLVVVVNRCLMVEHQRLLG